MAIRQAKDVDFHIVRDITLTTIGTVYPKYYPEGAVQFFCDHHSDERIIDDIESEKVFLFEAEGAIVGTVTISGNEINRLFVLPAYQHKGYGRMLMDFAEQAIPESFDRIVLDASLPAKSIYLKRGYRATEYHVIETANGDYLCYDVMEKERN